MALKEKSHLIISFAYPSNKVLYKVSQIYMDERYIKFWLSACSEEMRYSAGNECGHHVTIKQYLNSVR